MVPLYSVVIYGPYVLSGSIILDGSSYQTQVEAKQLIYLFIHGYLFILTQFSLLQKCLSKLRACDFTSKAPLCEFCKITTAPLYIILKSV